MPLGPPTQLRVGRRVDQCPDLAGLNIIPPDFGLLPASLPASKEPSLSQSKVGLCQSPEITPPRPSTEHLICLPLSLPIKAHLLFAQADLTPMRIHYASKAQRLRLPVSGKVKVPQAQPSLSMHPTKEESCKAPCHCLLPFSFTRLTRGRSHA